MKISIFKITILVFSIVALSSCKNDTSSKVLSINASDQLKSNNYEQIATGQNTLYDSDGNILTSINEGDPLYGQDANYLKGKKMSYKKNDDGTVTDLNTELMWQEI